jgi:hypothetical protein
MADGDSPLSTTSNIIGILTFALATFTFCVAFYAATADAPREAMSYKGYVEQRKKHIQEIGQFFEEKDVAADPDLEGSPLKGLVEDSIENAERLRTQLETNVYRICAHGEGMSLSQRVWWWLGRREMSMTMTSIDIQIQHLTALQITFLLR